MQSCIICLEEGANLKQLTHCGVYYVHKKCHNKWKSNNNTCIVCREPLTTLDTIVVQQVQPLQQVQHVQEVQQVQQVQRVQQLQHVQEEQQVQQIFQEIVQQNNNHGFIIINTLKFKVMYTIIVIIITLLAAFIFFIW